MNAHGITRTGPAKVSGAHLSDAANEPNSFQFTEQELLEADLAYLQGREQRDARRLALALEDQIIRLRAAGGL